MASEFEIWNELDSASLCVPAGTSHLAEYMKLYAAVVINPSQYSYRSVTVNAVNTGFASPLATLNEIKDGRSIQNSSLPLQSQGNGSYSATLPIGPYSVQAISLLD